MTLSDEPTTHLSRPPAPRTSPEVAVPEKRGALRNTRDFVAIVRDILLIALLLALFFLGGSVLKSIGDLGNDLSPDPASTCIGEEPC